MNKKGISLVGVKSIKEVEEIRERFPDAWFELSYMSTPESLKETLPLIKGRVASIHLLAPVRPYFPNLASDNSYQWSETEILKDAERALSLGAENLVLHPGYLVDGLVSRDYKTRLLQLKNLEMEEYMVNKEESVASPNYIESPRYKAAFSKMVENSLKLTEKIRAMGLCLALENLNPRTGYMVLHPDEIIYLANLGLDLCIDVGHLQVNSAIFGFDVLSQTKRILDTGKVKTMHLHSNPSCPGLYKDSHNSLDKFLPEYEKIIAYGEQKESNLILETLEDTLGNLTLLF